MEISFCTASAADLPAFMAMTGLLYEEDPSPQHPTPEHARRTFAEFGRHPEKGVIWLFENDGMIAGYSILVFFWSNEYGGDKVIVDEIFVRPEFRGKGISTAFFRHLEKEYASRAVALELEVTPDNAAARRLYERLGFRKAKNDYMVRRIRPGSEFIS